MWVTVQSGGVAAIAEIPVRDAGHALSGYAGPSASSRSAPKELPRLCPLPQRNEPGAEGSRDVKGSLPELRYA